jgi:hypothetical protein
VSGMSYTYATEKPKIFTESGQVMFLAIRDTARELLGIAGAFRQEELLLRAHTTGDSWQMLACVDRLVELGEIVEIPRQCWGQYKVYSSPKVHNH